MQGAIDLERTWGMNFFPRNIPYEQWGARQGATKCSFPNHLSVGNLDTPGLSEIFWSIIYCALCYSLLQFAIENAIEIVK